MIACKVCKQNFSTAQEFFTHIKYFHPRIVQITCPFRDCFRIYSNKESLRSHMNKFNHTSLTNTTNTEPVKSEHLLENKTNSFRVTDCTVDKNENKTSSILSDLKMDMMKHSVELLSDELISRKKSLEVLQKSFKYYSEAILKMKKYDDNLDTDNFKEFCEFFDDPSSVHSEYKLKKALKNAGVFIESKDHILSSSNYLKYVNGVPKSCKDERIVKLFDVPEFLKKFLNLPGMMHDIDSFVKTKENCNDGSISNIIQSPLWKKLINVEEKSNSVLFLPLNVYFDDFEPQNVLGSHSGAYKIGSVYMGLPCLPDHMISKLDFTFPVGLFFSEDRVDYGNRKVFQPIINMLNELYASGINVEYGEIRTVKFIVCLILGDNLGLNDILGFTKGFKANFFCRFCKSHRSLTHRQLIEELKSLRSYQNYGVDVLIGDMSKTGINENSVFNDIFKFHVIRNFCVDVLHDFFEGICHYDICNIIINLINKGYFTLDELNANLKHHNYGPFVKNKKLDPITRENLENTTLKMSGEEMKTFITNFSLIIGHRVDRNCPEWKLYIVLREICSIVTSKTVHVRSFELLESLVSEHHELYLQCFPYDTLKPKHHFMVHYPRILQLVGPVDLISSMRYESYHKKFKNVANVITCRVNLLTTFSKKIEFQIAKFLLNYEKPNYSANFGKMHAVNKYTLFQRYNFSLISKDIMETSWVQVGTVLIKKNCVIQIGLEVDDSPKFGLVEEIIIIDKSVVILGCRKIINLGFDRHFYAYSITETNCFFPISVDSVQATSYLFQGAQNEKFVCIK